MHPEVIVFGVGRYGGRLALGLKESGLRVLGIDFDPENVRAIRAKGLPVLYGDGLDADFLDGVPLDSASWLVCTLPDLESNRQFLRVLRERRFAGEVAFVAREDSEGAALKRAGAPTVLYPMRDAVDYTVEHLRTLIRPGEETSR